MSPYDEFVELQLREIERQNRQSAWKIFFTVIIALLLVVDYFLILVPAQRMTYAGRPIRFSLPVVVEAQLKEWLGLPPTMMMAEIARVQQDADTESVSGGDTASLLNREFHKDASGKWIIPPINASTREERVAISQRDTIKLARMIAENAGVNPDVFSALIWQESQASNWCRPGFGAFGKCEGRIGQILLSSSNCKGVGQICPFYHAETNFPLLEDDLVYALSESMRILLEAQVECAGGLGSPSDPQSWWDGVRCYMDRNLDPSQTAGVIMNLVANPPQDGAGPLW